jgi:hypothetical protein
MYAELDQVKAQVLGLATKVFPQADNFREEAKFAREQAREFKEEIPEAKKPKEFNLFENLKKLYRRVAKRIHSELASSETERERRHDLMAKLNQAYYGLDEETIRFILVEWEAEELAHEKLLGWFFKSPAYFQKVFLTMLFLASKRSCPRRSTPIWWKKYCVKCFFGRKSKTGLEKKPPRFHKDNKNGLLLHALWR